jgi:hypothetical protein
MLMLAFLFINCDFLNHYFLGFGMIVLMSVFFLWKKLRRDPLNEILFRLCDYEESFEILTHDVRNCLTVVFLENKDKALSPHLNKIKSYLNLKKWDEIEECSVVNIIEFIVRELDYHWNISIKKDCKIYAHYCELVLCFCYLLRYCVKRGSTIRIKEKVVTFSLKGNVDSIDLKRMLSRLCHCQIFIEKKQLFMKWVN